MLVVKSRSAHCRWGQLYRIKNIDRIDEETGRQKYSDDNLSKCWSQMGRQQKEVSRNENFTVLRQNRFHESILTEFPLLVRTRLKVR